MIYVEDVARTLVTAMEHARDGKVYPTAFEVGYGKPITVNEVAEKVIEIAGSTSVLEHSPMRPGEEEHGVVLAIPDTLAPLGITPESFVSLEEGLARTIEYYRNLL
jgi:UDP-glucose 4-epimerase